MLILARYKHKFKKHSLKTKIQHFLRILGEARTRKMILRSQMQMRQRHRQNFQPLRQTQSFRRSPRVLTK